MTTEKKGKAKKSDAENTVESVQPSTPAETTTSVESVQLTVNDLQLIAQIVDLASQRGAFRAPELEQVGAAYNKLAGFLNFVQNQEKEKAEAEKAETAAE